MINTGDTKYASNSAISADINELLPFFSARSQGRMRKAILDAKKSAEKYRDENTDAGARHIFREFIPATVLNQNGFSFEYEKKVQGKTPDWLDETAKIMLESYTYERGGSSNFHDRVSSSVSAKCIKYRDIVAACSLRFVVAVYIDFLTAILVDECREDSEKFRSVFDNNNSLWAILFFTETQVVSGKQKYEFFSLCADSSFEVIPNWPFQTMRLKQ